MPDGGMLVYADSQSQTADGSVLEDNGVTPDISIALDRNTLLQGRDVQLEKTIEYLEEKEMQAVLDAVDIKSRTGLRDQALFLLTYNTGARASEVVNMELTDLRLDAAQVRLHGKGNKQRVVPVGEEERPRRPDDKKPRELRDG